MKILCATRLSNSNGNIAFKMGVEFFYFIYLFICYIQMNMKLIDCREWLKFMISNFIIIIICFYILLKVIEDYC